MTLEIILAALVGSLPGLLALWRFKKVGNAEVEELEARADAQKADAADKLTDVAMQLVEPLQARVVSLEEEMGRLRRKLERSTRLIQALLRGLAVLTEQLRGLGVTPAFVIPVYNGSVAYLEKVLSDELGKLGEEDTW